MKRSHLLVACAAVLTSSACNGEKGTGGNSSAGAGPQVSQAVKAPANGNWSTVVTPTNQGGFVMGNPKAKVHLIEFGSLTCPHCREFDEQGVQPLIDKYVKSGKVSYEFRNYIRDGLDLSAALVARCNGAKSFFPLTRAIYKAQPQWFAKVQGASPAQQEALQNLPPDKQFVEFAKLAGFQPFAAMRGVPTAKSTACLSDQNEVNRLVQMTSDATAQYDVTGTPSFVLNGESLGDKARVWSRLEPLITKALGG